MSEQSSTAQSRPPTTGTAAGSASISQVRARHRPQRKRLPLQLHAWRTSGPRGTLRRAQQVFDLRPGRGPPTARSSPALHEIIEIVLNAQAVACSRVGPFAGGFGLPRADCQRRDRSQRARKLSPRAGAPGRGVDPQPVRCRRPQSSFLSATGRRAISRDTTRLPVTFSANGNTSQAAHLPALERRQDARAVQQVRHQPGPARQDSRRRTAPRAEARERPGPDRRLRRSGVPFCAKMHAELFPAITERYENQVRIVYRDFPLTEIHPWAMRAAIDANCLGAADARRPTGTSSTTSTPTPPSRRPGEDVAKADQPARQDCARRGREAEGESARAGRLHARSRTIPR